VVVVGHDALARHGLGSLLAAEPGLSVVGELAPRDLEGSATTEAVVWDLGASGRADLDALARAVSAGTIVLALVEDEDGVAGVLAAGARGALFRDAEGKKMAAALQALGQGLTVVDDGLAAAALRPPSPPPAALVEPLTPREEQVLQLLAQGLSNKKIAERLAISENTAKFHVNAILAKLGVESRTEALAQAARLGLVIF
jgi:two-component system nitrate/nitrite response regulator NarL